MKRPILALMLLWPLSVLADFQAGVDAYDRGDYATAYKELFPLAEQGDASAQNNVGTMFHNGEGVPQDFAEAANWYRLSADQGLAEAQYNLGILYFEEKGVPWDEAEAFKWFRLAAEQGYADAQFNIGQMHAWGWGVPEDYVRAYAWFSLAAAQGVKDANEGMKVVRRLMNPAQTAEAEKLGRKLSESIHKKQ